MVSPFKTKLQKKKMKQTKHGGQIAGQNVNVVHSLKASLLASLFFRFIFGLLFVFTKFVLFFTTNDFAKVATD